MQNHSTYLDCRMRNLHGHTHLDNGRKKPRESAKDLWTKQMLNHPVLHHPVLHHPVLCDRWLCVFVEEALRPWSVTFIWPKVTFVWPKVTFVWPKVTFVWPKVTWDRHGGGERVREDRYERDFERMC